MVAGRERQHGNRVPRIDRFRTRLVPVAAIFGGNASGKTNFFRALNFARSLVVAGTSQLGEPIPVEPFRLDEKSATRPSRFSFEFFVDDALYHYRFSVKATEIEDEELRVQKSSARKTLYSRKKEEIQFHRSLPDIDKLEMAFNLTRNNQLFLTSSLACNVDLFYSVYRWFDQRLKFVAPDSRFALCEYFTMGHIFQSSLSDALSRLDLGVIRVDTEDVPLARFLPTGLITDVTKNLKEGQAAMVRVDTSSRHIVFLQNGSLKAQKLTTYHRSSHGTEIKFEFSDESGGSQRVLDLLPAFLDLASSECDKTYVVDELGRSLHAVMARWLLEYFLDNISQQSRSQLLFTTHDAQLIDQSLFRRDEMWVTESDRHGASHLISLSEYRGLRKDKDILKAYLHGRVGGIPKIFA